MVEFFFFLILNLNHSLLWFFYHNLRPFGFAVIIESPLMQELKTLEAS